MGREHETQLSNDSPNGRQNLNQIYFVARVSQVNGGPHASDTASDYHHCSDLLPLNHNVAPYARILLFGLQLRDYTSFSLKRQKVQESTNEGRLAGPFQNQ
jgi:hypothetical protein